MNSAKQGWTFDEIGFYAFDKQIDNTVPIYQYHVKQEDGVRFHLSYSMLPAS